MKLPSPSRAPGARFRHFLFIPLSLILFFSVPARAQDAGNVVMRVPLQTTAGAPLLVSTDLLNGEQIEKVFLLYRSLGTADYARVEMDLRWNTATYLLPGRQIQAPYLEYYLVLQTRTGTLETYPPSRSADPITQPPENVLRVIVRPEEQEEAQVLFLSPDPDAPVEPEDVVISVSLLRADSTVDRKATRLLLDAVDVTTDAILSDDILVYVPQNFSRRLSPGRHRITVLLFALDGSLYRSTSRSFTVAGVAGEAEAEVPEEPLRYNASVQLESRHERVASSGTWYNRGGIQLSGTYGIWAARSNIFITSDEQSDRQPQNRYFIGASAPGINVGYGDGFPDISDLILNGKRVRGLHASVEAGMFNLDLVTGQTDRAIEGNLLKVIAIDSLALEQQRDPTAAYAPIDAARWGKYSYGTYERSLFAIRPSIGSGREWRVGLTALKAKDDDRSIAFGIHPQENLVVGLDGVTRLFENALELGGEWAFSAYNSDISSGTFTDAYIDSVYPNDASSIKRVRDILGSYITVNDNLHPLSLKRLATVAFQGWLGANAYGNEVKFTYLYRGNDYMSFGQSFLRRDIKGFNLTDRVRVLENRLFFSGGLERLQDNTGRTRVATTTYSTVDFAASYYPLADFPTITVGISHLENANGLPTRGTDSLAVIDEVGNRFFLQTSYGFRYEGQQTAAAGFSFSDRDDRSVRDLDVRNLALTLSLTTQYEFPLQTTLEFMLNRNEFPSSGPGTTLQNFNYSTLTIGARYTLIENLLLCRAAASPTFGDLDRAAFMGGVEWYLTRLMSLVLDGSYFQQPAGPYDSIWSLRYKYDL